MRLPRGLSSADSGIPKLICPCGPQWVSELLHLPTEVGAHAVGLVSCDCITCAGQAPAICAATAQPSQGCSRPSGPAFCAGAHICSAQPIPLADWLITQSCCFNPSFVVKSQTNNLAPPTRPGKRSCRERGKIYSWKTRFFK